MKFPGQHGSARSVSTARTNIFDDLNAAACSLDETDMAAGMKVIDQIEDLAFGFEAEIIFDFVVRRGVPMHGNEGADELLAGLLLGSDPHRAHAAAPSCGYRSGRS